MPFFGNPLQKVGRSRQFGGLGSQPGFNRELSQRASTGAQSNAFSAGRGVFNQINRGLVGTRNAGVASAADRGARVQGGIFNKFQIGQQGLEQNFNEGQRQFDLSTLMGLRGQDIGQNVAAGRQNLGRAALTQRERFFNKSQPGFLDFLGGLAGNAASAAPFFL